MPDKEELPVKRYEMDRALLPLEKRLDIIDGIRGRLDALEYYNKEREKADHKRANWLLGIASAVVIVVIIAILPVVATFIAQALNGATVK